MKFTETIVLCFLITLGSAAKFPASFKRCKVSPELDNKPNECLREAIENAILQLADNGNKELGVLDLDPLKINEVLIERGENNPVAVKLKFVDNDLYGIENIKIKSVNGKFSSPKDFKMVIIADISRFQLSGLYTVNGKILILPIQGEGQSNLTMTNIKYKMEMSGEPQTKNGKEYLKLTDTKIEILPSRLHTYLGNLFNGDKALGDNMNKFLNENWNEIYMELKPSVEGAFAAILEAYSRGILERIQYKNIFLTE